MHMLIKNRRIDACSAIDLGQLKLNLRAQYSSPFPHIPQESNFSVTTAHGLVNFATALSNENPLSLITALFGREAITGRIKNPGVVVGAFHTGEKT